MQFFKKNEESCSEIENMLIVHVFLGIKDSIRKVCVV